MKFKYIIIGAMCGENTWYTEQSKFYGTALEKVHFVFISLYLP